MSHRPSMTSTSAAPKADRVRVAEQLAAMPLFRGADAAELRTIADSGVVVHVPAGWSLIWAKTAADKAYVVLDGGVEVRLPDTDPIRLGPGEVIGEAAILQRRLRSATVVAATDLQVLHFTDEAVRRLHADVPAFRDALDATVRSRSEDQDQD